MKFVRSDAWLLAAIAEHSPSGSAQKLQEFVHDCDWLNRSLPTFDEVSFGLQRLSQAGYVELERELGKILRLKATPQATQLGERVHAAASTLGDVLDGFNKELATPSYLEPEIEDRSLGRLPDFREDEWDAAVDAYGQWFHATAKELLGIDMDQVG